MNRNIVLERNGNDALLYSSGAPSRYIVAHGYDDKLDSWSYGSYFNNIIAAARNIGIKPEQDYESYSREDYELYLDVAIKLFMPIVADFIEDRFPSLNISCKDLYKATSLIRDEILDCEGLQENYEDIAQVLELFMLNESRNPDTPKPYQSDRESALKRLIDYQQ